LAAPKCLSEEEITRKIDSITADWKKLHRKTASQNQINVFIRNQYFLYVYKVYADVRLVGAPRRLRKFGGDTDNWICRATPAIFALPPLLRKDNEQPVYRPKCAVHPKSFSLS
jgi:hypothetical protein